MWPWRKKKKRMTQCYRCYTPDPAHSAKGPDGKLWLICCVCYDLLEDRGRKARAGDRVNGICPHCGVKHPEEAESVPS